MVIRMRSTRSHTGNRRSHHALKGTKLNSCSKCKKPVLAHTLCTNCGSYKGREVVDVMAKTKKKEKKAKKKESAK